MASERKRLVVLAMATVASGACVDTGAAEVSILPEVVNYRSQGFTRVNRGSYPSDLDSSISIDVWVSENAREAYAEVTPDDDGARVYLPDGTVIVREVHEPDSGKLIKLTIMVKGPPGHAPEVGDWWFAVTDESGVPLVDEATGERLAGDLQQCYGCHQARPDDDFVFGVPDEVRPGHDDDDGDDDDDWHDDDDDRGDDDRGDNRWGS